jgi:hypothetical protein
MIPALNQTYMTAKDAKEKRVPFVRNVLYIAGILDQANIAAHKRLENEGLSQYVKRYSFQKTIEGGSVPDFGKGILVTGKPSAEERKRIDEIVGGLNSQVRPIGVALTGYVNLAIKGG